MCWRCIIGVLAIVLLVGGVQRAAAQQNPNIAEATHPLGFTLKKVVSNTTICSGQTFSYTIYYSFPAGTQQVTITDQIPSPLLVQSVTVSNVCGTPTVSAPPPGSNGTVTVQWTSIPAGGCSGSLTIVVSFPNGTTCNGTTARNRVCLVGIVKTSQGNQVADFCTPFVSTTAQATNPWQIQKNPLGATWAGGNCQWKYAGDTMTYQIQVCKNNPAPCGGYGQLNLVNGVVTDVLPAGALFVGASCTGVTYNSGTNTITWNVGNLSATPPYNCASCNIKVYYPPSTFPTNSQITNTATLSGQLGSSQNPCGQFTQSSTVCWTKVLPPPPTTNATLFKWVSTNGQPGCSGQYTIQFCNNGNTTISSATIRDTLHAGLTITGTSQWPTSGFTISTSGNIVTATLASPLPPNTCRWLYINFSISPTATPNSTITNCAWAQVPGLAPMQSCVSFVVNAPSPTACIQKEICSQQASYTPGQIIRVRFRLQNIGGQNISGATLTDNLNPNFQYIGNPAFYTSNSWSTPCNPQSGTSAWTPSPTISVSGQTITISNITIPATCQNLFWSGCGFYGNTGVPYYWVEFDVKIADTAGLGNIPNFYTLSGGGLAQPVQSNTVLVLVTGNVGFTLDKKVASDTTNWQNSLTSTAGSTVNYRLRLNFTGTVGLRHVTFIDLLPRDNGAADDKILQACGSRGSQYDVTYQSLVLSSPGSAASYNNAATTLADANAISSATSAPANLFPNKCGTSGSWTSGVAAGNKNVGFYFGSSGIGVSTPPTVVFSAKLSNNAQPAQLACNTFAAGGAVRHYLNSSTSQDVPVGPLESAPVCVTIDSSSRCYDAQLQGVPIPIGVVSWQGATACKYQVTVGLNNPGPATQGCAYSPQGTVTPNSFTVPNGASTLTLTFIDTPPPNNFACIIFGTPDPAGVCAPCDTVCFDLRPCPQQDTCCPRFERVSIKCIGPDSAGNMMYSIVGLGTIPCKAQLIISSPEGAFSPSVFGIGPGSFTINTTFTDLPPAAGASITVYYTIIGGSGTVLCRDSGVIKLPPCPQQPRNCCMGWWRRIQSQVKWFSNGAVQISGTLGAGPAPIHRFAAAIVSAQLKRWCPIIPPPSAPWQRIFGDMTSGWLIPAPGAPQMLTPYSRQIVWEGPIPDSCISWGQLPASFQLNMLFPAPTGFKCGDSLRFTVRYTFTDCECRSCDTLITYTVVRKKQIIALPWEPISAAWLSRRELAITLPNIVAVSADTTERVALRSIELKGITPRGIRVEYCQGSGDECQWQECTQCYVKTGGGNVLVVWPSNAEGGQYRIVLEDTDPGEELFAILSWEENEGTNSQTVTISIPPYSDRPNPSGIVVQDRESAPPHVRTFALAFVNGDIPVEEISIELKALPQPDGTIPAIIAMGPIDGSGITIKCCSYWRPNCPCYWVISEPLEPGAVFRPLFVTVAGAKRDALDAVEVEYTLTDRNGTVIRRGRILLEGAISGIEQPDEGDTERAGITIGSIIPNPATENATVAIKNPSAPTTAQVVLYDALGRQVAVLLKGAMLPSGTTAVTVNLSELPAGVYSIVVRSTHGVDMKRFVVTR
ncbi:MAG: T9SS type A sorting domain-containing protein [Bacteroidota bacterium]|nr:T9SS type A sorting domain-containing protein [Bacteroidota bacterium]